MKRLCTFILLAIFTMGFTYAQLPMVVKGKMKVASNGNLKSVGTVHVKADDNTAGTNGAILNEGALTINTGQDLIFYSNDIKDGLLLNKTENGVTTPSLKVRKKFATSGKWYTMSFPFDIDLINSVYMIRDGVRSQATLWDDFAVAYYNAERRAETGQNTGNWTMYPENTTSLPAGEACRIATNYSGVTSFELEFITPASEISSLLKYEDKSIPVSYYECELFLNPLNSTGWNVIGGTNVSAFNFYSGGSETWDFEGPIHVYTGSGTWTQYTNDPDVDEDVTLSPYVTFYIQVTEDRTSVTYKTPGYSLDNARPATFRNSDQEKAKDIFALSLIKDDWSSDKVYIMFREDYNEEFVIEEDGLKLLDEEKITTPRIWSNLQMGSSTYSLFLNRLPRIEGNRELSLGVSIPSSRKYTFDLDELKNETAQSITLLDKYTGIRTDIQSVTYTVNLDQSDNINDRFVLLFNAPTSLTDITNVSDIYAYVENDILIIKNLNIGNSIAISDLTGRNIFTGIATSDQYQAPLRLKGAYIINVTGDKNAIIKVLNQ